MKVPLRPTKSRRTCERPTAIFNSFTVIRDVTPNSTHTFIILHAQIDFMQEAFIYDCLRTPRGKGRVGGALYEVRPIELLAQCLKAIQARNDLDTSLVDDFIAGCVTPIEDQGAVISKAALLFAGWADCVSGIQINRFCASGLEAVNLGAAKIISGIDEMVLAGGVESMSRVPMEKDGGPLLFDPEVNVKVGYVPQGISADLIATKEAYSREELDAYAFQSQQRAATAVTNGFFSKSIIPICDAIGIPILENDEHPRPQVTMESLSNLKPVFANLGAQGFDSMALRKFPEVEKIKHLHTAGTSSGIVDGAALVLLGSKAAGEKAGIKPRAKIISMANVSTDPVLMLTGPAPAAQKALQKAGLTIDDIDLFEMNEAFSAPVLKFQRALNVPDEKLNVNGGAIAFGHPLGATGAMLLGTLVDELERRELKRGLVTLCVGAGMGIATIIERV